MRFEEREAGSRGHRISYLAGGEGEPLLLVNGLGAPGRAWIEAGYAGKLTQTRRVLIADTLGHAASDKPIHVSEYQEPAVALDLLAVLDAEQISEPADIWGYSRGGRLSLMLALEAPDRLRSVVAGGCTVGAPKNVQSGFAAALAAPLLEGNWDGYWEMVPMARELQVVVEETTSAQVAGMILQGLADAPYPFDLARLRVPVLFYVGESDVFAALAADDAEMLGTDLWVLNGMDHGEAFARSDAVLPGVREFWKKTAGAKAAAG